MRTLLLAVGLSGLGIVLYGLGSARADVDDGTLRFLLEPAELVVVAKINTDVAWQSDEVGVVFCVTSFVVKDVLKGAWNERQLLRADVVRFGLGDAKEMPFFKKGAECILFLRRAPKGTVPAWTTTNMWLGAQHHNPALARALKRIAKPAKKSGR